MENKICSKCKTYKSIELFYRRSKAPNARQTWCKDCQNRRRKTHKEHLQIKEKTCMICDITKSKDDFYTEKRNRDGRRAYCKKCDIGRKSQYSRKSRLKASYGITEQEYDNMVCGQEGICLICKTLPGKLYIDHDHETGKLRGLLCNSCNMKLGWFEKNENGILKYLNR